MDRFQRTEMLIGNAGMKKLSCMKVAVFGLGGVGGFVCEALARVGIGNIKLIDKDTIDETNINRQIIATTRTIGLRKVDVMYERIKDINPNCNVEKVYAFVNEDNVNEMIDTTFDYVVDAIDTVYSKVALIIWCKSNNINIISSMGTGNKLNPLDLKIKDIYKTNMDPLAKVMRKELRRRNVKDLKVLYSEENPIKVEKIGEKIVPGSISTVPSVAGLVIASQVIKDLL